MNKLVCAMLAVSSSLLFTNVALANDAKPAFETIKTTAGAVETKSAANYATDIIVTNFSSHFINMQVPGYSFSAVVYPNAAQHFHGYDSTYKRVVLSDYSGIVFYDALTPNYYPIDVYDARNGTTVAKVGNSVRS